MQDLNRLIAAFNAGRLADAIALGEAMLRQHGPSAEVYNVLGAAYTQQGGADKAAECFAQSARLAPSAAAYNSLGIALASVGRLPDAAESFQRAIKADARFAEGFNNLGFCLNAMQRHAEAEVALRQAVALRPKYADAHNNLGIALAQRGAWDEAIKTYERARKLQPDNPRIHNNLGNALTRSGRAAEAQSSYRRALELDPGFADAHSNLGSALLRDGQTQEAIAALQRSLSLNANSADAWSNLGAALRDAACFEEAMAALTRALKLKADHVEAWNHLGLTLAAMQELDKAVDIYRRALLAAPDAVEVLNNLGNALSEQGRLDEAAAALTRAVTLEPAYADAHNNLGLVLRKMGRPQDAVGAFSRALELRPTFADAHLSLAVALADLRRHADAIESFTRALEFAPDNVMARAQRLHQQALICDWEGVARDAPRIPSLGVTEGIVPPFALLSLEDDPERHRIRAARFAAERFAAPSAAPARPARRREQLRIGYVSADVRNHAVMYLIARTFELHDRSRFAVHMYSYGPDDGGDMRKRIAAGVDVFRDIRAARDADVLDLMRRDELDVAIDLSGHTMRSRTGLFAHRIAPVQINFLGYPGTIGAPFMDYLIADHTIIPADARHFYSEKIIYLPNAYQPNDDTRPIAAAPTRAQEGLPEQAFVFCSFNNNYKITPAEFDVWIALLQSVESSVLWLLSSNERATANLRSAASARGVDPARLVFAPPVPQAEHLARHQLADIFLDTFNYNAHTTASDALWAGLPVVTKLGEGFAARVAGSLLRAVGLPELVTGSVEDYAALARRLAQEPAALAAVRAKLARTRSAAPLFNSALFTRHLEAAFDAAYQRYLDGGPPDTIEIAP